MTSQRHDQARALPANLQFDRAQQFQALHARPGVFIIPNPYDAGTARVLAALGFEALATTSAGLAFVLGRPEGSLPRELHLQHCREIAAATDLPVSADLENCFADDPAGVAETISLALGTGIVGCSVEDTTGNPGSPIYDFDHAVERVAAAVEAARACPFPFTLTARAENYLHGRPDLDDTIRRLQAFEAAGADVLYAPGLTRIADIGEVCSALEKPVNVVMGLAGGGLSVPELAAAGVKRISVGSALARLAIGAVVRAAKEMRDAGTFEFGKEAMSFSAVEALLAGGQTG